MKRSVLLSTFILLFFSPVLFAQPANDDCQDAVEITDLDGSCDIYDATDATPDIAVGNCGDYNINNSENVWFSFTAQGPDVTIDVNSQADFQITLLEFEVPCMGSPEELGCDEDIIEEDDVLEAGNIYYVLVTFEEDMGTEFELCINNPMAAPGPPNDDPCAPIGLDPDGGCHNGTNDDASPDFSNPNCPNINDASVWYTTVLTGNNNALTIDLTDVTIPGDASIVVGTFPNGCNNSGQLVNGGSYCGPLPTTMEVTGLETGVTYYIGIMTEENNTGDFMICVEQMGPPPGCSENDLCNEAEEVSPVVTGDPPACVDGCNIGAGLGELAGSGCYNFSNLSTVWFSFMSDADATHVNVTVNSDDINGSITLALVEWDCSSGTYIPHGCNSGNNGEVDIIQQDIPPNTNFIVIVGTPTGGTGTFDLCIVTTQDASACVLDSDLEVTNTSNGSPLEGPYQPGEEVTFQYTVNSYTSSGNNCQWFQGIVPVFGNGWDPNSFLPTGEPVDNSGVPTLYGGDWSWYEENVVTYNHTTPNYATYQDDVYDRLAMCSTLDPDCTYPTMMGGDGLPAGWFAVNTGSPCANTGPNTSWGDGSGCGTTMGPWTVTFTLTTRQFPGPEGCDETGYTDTDVTIFTFADGETGCWTGSESVCAQDQPEFWQSQNQCCQGPMLDNITAEVCSGEQTNIELTSNQDPDATYSWTVEVPAGVTGAADGSGKFITQILTNNTTTTKIVTYVVTPYNDVLGCYGQPEDVEVTVFPDVTAEAGEDKSGCAQGTYILGGTPTGGGGGGGPYTYNWSNGAGTGANPSVSPNTTTTYTVTVTDANGCTSTDEVTVDVSPAVIIELDGDPEYCEEDGSTTITVNPVTGTPSYTYEWNTPEGIFNNGGNPNFMASMGTGEYTVTVTDAAGCTGEKSIEITEHPTPLVDLLVNPDQMSFCPGETFEIISIPQNYDSYEWTTPTVPMNGSIIDGEDPGTYTVTVTTDAGCVNFDSVTIEQQMPPSPVILGDTVICSGESTTIAVDSSYVSFSWSTGAQDSSISVSSVGSYTVTVTDAIGCMGTDEITVIQDHSAQSDAGPDTLLTCDLTEVTLDGSNSSSGADITYEWTTGGGNIVSGEETLTPLVDSAGMYYLVVTNNMTGCAQTDSVEVTLDQSEPVADAGPDQEITCANQSASLGGNSDSGAPFTLNWYDEDDNQIGSDPTIEVSEAGTYVLEIINNDNGCMNSDSVTVTENKILPTADAGAADTLNCVITSFALNGSGSTGSGQEDISWTADPGNIVSGGNTYAPTVDAPGMYILTVVDPANGCERSDTVMIDENVDYPEVSIAEADTLDCVTTAVTLDASVDDPDNPYDYQWSGTSIVNGGNTLTPEVDAPGTYTITVTNTENQCTATASVVLSEDVEQPTAEAGASQELTCDIETLLLDGTGSSTGAGITYLWTTSGGNIINGETTLQPEIDAAGTYYIEVTDQGNGCTAVDSVEITVDDDVPVADAGPGFTLDCDQGQVNLDGTGSSSGQNFSYEWTTSDGNIVSGINTLNPLVDAPGTYVLTVHNSVNDCEATSSVIVSEDIEEPTTEAGPAQTIDCDNSSVILDGTGSSSGPEFIYEWTSPDGNILNGASGLQAEVDAPGTYYLNIINEDNGCEGLDSVLVDENTTKPQAEVELPDTLTCLNPETVLDGSGSDEGPNFEYSWNVSGGGNIVSGADTHSPTVDAPGTYELTVLNTTNGCESTATVTVTEDVDYPVADAGSPATVTCENPVVMLDGSGSESGASIEYDWSSPDGGVIESGTDGIAPEVSAAGTYVITVTNTANGCTNTASVVVDEDKEEPTADAGTTQELTCSVESLTLDGSGSDTGADYTYQWTASNGGNILSGSTDLNPEVNAAGTYTLVVTDQSNGCTAEASVEVTLDEDVPDAMIGTPALLTCDVKEITLDATGSSQGASVNYAWSTSDGNILSGGSGLNPVVDAPGTYVLEVMDESNDCASTATVVVEEDVTAPVVDAGETFELTCTQSSAILSGSADTSGIPLEIEWSTADGNIKSGGDTYNPVIDKAGTYVLTVTNRTNGCSGTDEVVITKDEDLPTADPGASRELTCLQETVVLDGTASSTGSEFTYRWTTSDGNILTDPTQLQITVDQPGVYVLKVTNTMNSCVATSSVTVSENKEYPIVDAGPVFELTCRDSVLNLDGSGSDSGPQYDIQWTTGDGNILEGIQSLNPLVNRRGTYVLRIENTENGCVSYDSVDVAVNDDVIADIEAIITQPICAEDEDGCITITDIEGGTGTIQFALNGGEMSPSAQFCNLTPGQYTVHAQDENGCALKEEFTIIQPPIWDVRLDGHAIIEPGDSVLLQADISLPPDSIRRINWNVHEEISCDTCSSVLIYPEQDGTYSVLVVDEFGCVRKAFVNISIEQSLDVYIPNAFSPNGDGTNDKFVVFADAEDVETIRSVRVFDRWGNQVFERSDVPPNDESQGWDGRFDGQRLSPAVFVYVVEVEFVDGSSEIFKGDVTLIR